MSEQGLRLVQRFENFAPKIYLCPAGYPTIGYGHVVTRYEKFSEIDKEQADRLLAADLLTAELAVGRWITAPLTQCRFDALVSFTFNLGGGALQRSQLRQVVNRQEHEAVPHQFLRWVFAAGKILPGLVGRRKAEAYLYQNH